MNSNSEEFKGVINIPVFHKDVNQIIEIFGDSYKIVRSKEFAMDFDEFLEYKQPYGFLYFYFDNDICTEIYLTTKSLEKCEKQYQKIVRKTFMKD